MKIPNHIVFQRACSAQAIQQCLDSGSTTIVTTQGTKNRFLDELLQSLSNDARHDVQTIVLPSHTPDFESSRVAFEATRHPSNQILAIGGGSVIDTAKVIALKRSSQDFFQVEEAIRNNQYWDAIVATPIVAIPTTAGTGSSLTRWGTVWDRSKRQKYSVNHSTLTPSRAYFDPELTLSAPRELTICCALDAMSHAFESIWNLHATS